jgi:hypothetical protein
MHIHLIFVLEMTNIINCTIWSRQTYETYMLTCCLAYHNSFTHTRDASNYYYFILLYLKSIHTKFSISFATAAKVMLGHTYIRNLITIDSHTS